MPITPEQQAVVDDLMLKYPSQIPKIMEYVKNYEQQNEGTLSRSWDLASNSFMRELPMGFGDELGLSDPNQPEARNIVESAASGLGSLAGMAPSLVGTMGLAGVGGRILGRAVPALAKKVGSETAKRVLLEGGVGATHAALSKQEGETGFFDQDFGQSAYAGLMGGVTGATVGGAVAKLNSADSKLAETVANTMKSYFTNKTAQNAAIRGTTMGAGALAGAVSSAPFMMAEGGTPEQVLIQSLAMGLLSGFEALPKKYLSEVRNGEIGNIVNAVKAEGRRLTPEESAKIIELSRDMPGGKERVDGVLAEVENSFYQNQKAQASAMAQSQMPGMNAYLEGQRPNVEFDTNIEFDNAIKNVYNLVDIPDRARRQRELSDTFREIQGREYERIFNDEDLRAIHQKSLSKQLDDEVARKKLSDAYGKARTTLDKNPELFDWLQQNRADEPSPKQIIEAEPWTIDARNAETHRLREDARKTKLQFALQHTSTGGAHGGIQNNGKKVVGWDPSVISTAKEVAERELKKAKGPEVDDWQWVVQRLNEEGGKVTNVKTYEQLYDNGTVTEIAQPLPNTTSPQRTDAPITTQYEQGISQYQQLVDEIDELRKDPSTPPEVIAKKQDQADELGEQLQEAQEFKESYTKRPPKSSKAQAAKAFTPTKSVGAATTLNTDPREVLRSSDKGAEVLALLDRKGIDPNELDEWLALTPAMRGKGLDYLSEEHLDAFLLMHDDAPSIFGSNTLGKVIHNTRKVIDSMADYVKALGNRTMQEADEIGLIDIDSFHDMTDMLDGTSTQPKNAQELLERGLIMRSGDVYRLTNEGKRAIGGRMLVQYGHRDTKDFVPGTILELTETGQNASQGASPLYFDEMVIRKNANGKYEPVFQADADLATLKLDTGQLVLQGEQGGIMSVGNRQYQMQPGDIVVRKPAALQLSDKLALRQKTADLMTGSALRDFRHIYDDLLAEIESRGLDAGEELIDRPTEVMIRDRDLFPTEKRISDKGDGKGPTRYAFMDGLEQRTYTDANGNKTFITDIDDLRRIADPNIQSVKEQADGSMRIPAWWIPYIERIKTLTDTFADAATAAELRIKIGDEVVPWTPRELYAPFIHDPKLYDDPNWIKSQISELMAKNEEWSVADAEAHVKRLVDLRKKHARSYANLESRREITPLEGYVVNPLIRYGQYFMRASERITDAHLFGNFNQEARALITEAKLQGGDDFIEKVFDRVLGLEDRALPGSTQEAFEHVADKMKMWTMITKMGMSFLPQMSQIVNTASMTGYIDTLRGLSAMIRKANKDVVEDSFAVAVETIRGNVAQELGLKTTEFPKWAVWLKAFSKTDELVRNWSANTAVVYINRNLERLVKDPSNIDAQLALKELRIDPQKAYSAYLDREANPKGWDKMLALGANTLSKETQFLARPETLPYFAKSPLGGLVTQFKTFTLFQANFLNKHMNFLRKNDPARWRKVKNAIKYMVGATVVGEGVADVKGVISGVKREEWDDDDALPWERILWNISTVGGFGIGVDMLRAMAEGRYSTAELLIGPAMSQVVRLAADNTSAVAQLSKSVIDDGEFDWSKLSGAMRTNIGAMPIGINTQIARRIVTPEKTRWQYVDPLEKGGMEHILTGKDPDPMAQFERQKKKMREEMRKMMARYQPN